MNNRRLFEASACQNPLVYKSYKPQIRKLLSLSGKTLFPIQTGLMQF